MKGSQGKRIGALRATKREREEDVTPLNDLGVNEENLRGRRDEKKNSREQE